THTPRPPPPHLFPYTTLFRSPADPADRRIAQVAADDIAAEGQRQPRPLLPPDAEIYDQMQTLVMERQLTFVDDKARFKLACRHRDRKSTRLNSSHLVISYAVF